MDLKNYLKERCAIVDDALDRYLPGETDLPVSVHRAMRYSVFAGGKRIRPVLMLAACEAVGGAPDLAIPAACAMEMIHTYSLIHDDLPAMDDDDFRRGRPTNHKVFGEAIAILAGDALLTEAFILMSSPEYAAKVGSARILPVIHEIGICAGSRGMVGGQVVDMESEGKKDIDLATVQYIHTHKTGALMKASVKAGAILGGAEGDTLAAMTRYGEAIGLAFQIADDILDIEGTTEQIGKDAGSDEARGKATYPAVMGLADSKRRAQELVDMALESLSPFGEKAEPLREIARYIVARKS
ncbi:polyprenyl synthetase family protein [Geobacter hydrogenophilus]|uniref:Farnesyl-diphosphate synthase n=1 Tax=Geobacter hydrogenophilus TaxID=40983 RepID=A0A9W6FXC6_9BACT|nr:farnesyl diphosphate synthase [Geobacter hydrogenophilus]MBT0895256.1 polyprenyl synthetase family protein [Geobacter hydrogenophilus]GLI36562.1 farnesyl-diphosphate synthase [Geobacter hydrogenophilus]